MDICTFELLVSILLNKNTTRWSKQLILLNRNRSNLRPLPNLPANRLQANPNLKRQYLEKMAIIFQLLQIITDMRFNGGCLDTRQSYTVVCYLWSVWFVCDLIYD